MVESGGNMITLGVHVGYTVTKVDVWRVSFDMFDLSDTSKVMSHLISLCYGIYRGVVQIGSCNGG